MSASRKMVVGSAAVAATLMATSVAVAMAGSDAQPRPEIVAEPSVLRIDDVRPGQERHATMTLANTAPVDAAVSAVVSASGEVVDAGGGLNLRVFACDVPWDGQVCSADEPALLLGEAVSGTVSARTDYELGAGQTSHLLVGVALDESAGNSAQGLSGEMSLTWVGIDAAIDPDNPPTPGEPEPTPEPEPTEDPEPEPSDPGVEEPTEDPTEGPTQPAEDPTDEPVEEDPTEVPSDPIVINPPDYVAPDPNQGNDDDADDADGRAPGDDSADDSGDGGAGGGDGDEGGGLDGRGPGDEPGGDDPVSSDHNDTRTEHTEGDSDGDGEGQESGISQRLDELSQTGVPSVAALGLLAAAAAGLGALLLRRRRDAS